MSLVARAVFAFGWVDRVASAGEAPCAGSLIRYFLMAAVARVAGFARLDREIGRHQAAKPADMVADQAFLMAAAVRVAGFARL
jgi:hypothetical protein